MTKAGSLRVVIPEYTKGLSKFINKKMESFNFLLGYKKNKEYNIYCTKCNKWHTSKERHEFGKNYKCPNCGGKYQYKMYRVKNLSTRMFASTIQKIENGIVIRTYWVDKWLKQDKTMFTKYFECVRDLYIDGKWYKHRSGITTTMGMLCQSGKSGWNLVRNNYNYGVYDIGSYLYKANLKETKWQYSQIEKYGNYIGVFNVKEYIEYYKPQFELLVKAKLEHLVGQNVNLKDIRQNYDIIKKHRLDRDEIEMLKYTKDIKTVKFFARYDTRDIRTILNKCDLITASEYLCKQKRDARYYNDYLNMALEIGELDKYPRDLEKSHDDMNNKIEYLRNQEYDDAISKLGVDKYLFKKGKYVMQPIHNTQELIDEGKKMHHCVGSYAKKYARGECIILSLRNGDDLDKPLVTIEINDKEVVQARGVNNAKPHKTLLKFIEKFSKEKELAYEIHN